MKLKSRTNSVKTFKTMYVIVFGIVACLMLAGYAALSREVKINGTANVSSTSWDVHFETVQVTNGSVTTTAANAAQIVGDSTVKFTVDLKKPGDFYEFTVNVKNGGNIDAMIGDIVKTPDLTETQAKYLVYTATYSDGGVVEKKDKLAANSTKTIRIRVEYKKDLTASDLPTTAPSFELAYTLNFAQADNTAVVK